MRRFQHHDGHSTETVTISPCTIWLYFPCTRRLQFLRFERQDPTGWVHQEEQFKRFNNLPDDQMATMAPLNLSSDAIEWHQEMEKTLCDLTWCAVPI